jgi:hypothetical protein
MTTQDSVLFVVLHLKQTIRTPRKLLVADVHMRIGRRVFAVMMALG